MLGRVAVTAAMVLVASLAEAREPWHAEVTPARPSLPAVKVELGYPGPYVPTPSAPITLRATAGERPFDGYIGFHFRVGENRTADTPVIARAVLRPRQTWTFSTFVTLRIRVGPLVPREMAIEWRDASMRVVAVQRAGEPAWTTTTQLMPLRIVATPGPTSVLGRTAYSERPDALSDRAQWYAGFSELVSPLEVWLDLPRRVREAILGSGIHVVLFGLPRSGQAFDDIDGALLPLTFQSRPGSYRAPWPWGKSDAVAVPVSWTVKKNAAVLGPGPLPYMVKWAVATWVADEAGISRPLPAMTVIPIRPGQGLAPKELSIAWPRPAQILRMHPALLLTLAAALISLTAWLIVRKRPRVAMTAALVIGAMVVLAARDRVRPPAGTYRYDIETSFAPGIVDSLRLSRSYGLSPIAEEKDDPETMRTSVTGAAREWEDAEVRTSTTPVAMGLMQRETDWNAITRWSRRRGLGQSPLIRVRSRDGKSLVIEYESPLPVNYIYADWWCGTNLCSGATAVRWGRRGSATIKNARTTWPEAEPLARAEGEGSPVGRAMREVNAAHQASVAGVWLVQKARTHTRILRWLEPSRQAGQRQPGSFQTTRERIVNESGSVTFALPPEVSPDMTAVVNLNSNSPSARPTVTWETGRASLAPAERSGLPNWIRPFPVPSAVLQEILARGGVVQVAMSPEDLATIDPFDTVSIQIREKKP